MGARSKWDPPPKVENDHVEVWDFQLQMDEQVTVSQLDTVSWTKDRRGL